MRRTFLSLLGIAGFLVTTGASAAPASITYSYEHHIFTVNIARMTGWRTPAAEWFFHDIQAEPIFCTDNCSDIRAPDGWTKKESATWNKDAIKKTLDELIGAKFDRSPGSAKISRSGSKISIQGVGLPGRTVDTLLAAELTVVALNQNISHVSLPVVLTQPTLDIDPALKAQGITEVVTVGESTFYGSTANRRHNIRVGLAKFNGHLIQKGETFSFVKVLGPVNASTGYRQELVIKGDRTVPDYGGGLCQVSSTAYRGVWEYGFPITQRKNHSYTVSYYFPQGTDATVYPPNVDIKFLNDSSGALLIQTYMDNETDHAYFIYYGTKDNRTAEVFGPYIWSTRTPPPEKIEYTTDLPPGEKKKLGERVPGFTVSWFRSVMTQTGAAKVQETYSSYEARPLFYQVGINPAAASGASLEAADVIDG